MSDIFLKIVRAVICEAITTHLGGVQVHVQAEGADGALLCSVHVDGKELGYCRVHQDKVFVLEDSSLSQALLARPELALAIKARIRYDLDLPLSKAELLTIYNIAMGKGYK
jgi:hypothetical protein